MITVRTWISLLTLAIAVTAASTHLAAQPSATTTRPATTFGWIDVYLTSETEPLAAYQLEVTADRADLRIVGVEGGEHPAFQPAPYYDPEALQRQRVVIAAFSTAAELPYGRTRVARVHILTSDPAPVCRAALRIAANADGRRIPVEVQLVQGTPE